MIYTILFILLCFIFIIGIIKNCFLNISTVPSIIRQGDWITLKFLCGKDNKENIKNALKEYNTYRWAIENNEQDIIQNKIKSMIDNYNKHQKENK